jgi:hypothetical protein
MCGLTSNGQIACNDVDDGSSEVVRSKMAVGVDDFYRWLHGPLPIHKLREVMLPTTPAPRATVT